MPGDYRHWRYRPDPTERVPGNMCLRCGMLGKHRDAEGCIAALRNVIAELQIRLAKAGQRVPTELEPPRPMQHVMARYGNP